MEQTNAFDAIKCKRDLEDVRSSLAARPMERLLFELGISSGLRLSDILSLRVRDTSPGGALPRPLSYAAEEALKDYINIVSPKSDDYLFRKRRVNEPIAKSFASSMVTSWFLAAGLEGYFGARSLFKTWQLISSGNLENKSAAGKVVQPYTLTPVRASSLESVVKEQLYKAIITGAIPIGTKLVVSRLAQQLTVGPMYVRIALAKLEEQGIIKEASANNYVVRSLTAADIMEIRDIRTLIECHAFDCECENWSDDNASLLADLLNKWKVTRNPEECVYYHSAFHVMLYKDIAMPLLLEYIKNLADRTNAYHIRAYARTETDWEQEHAEISKHLCILDAMRMHDFGKAKSLLIKNIAEGCELCLVSLSIIGQNIQVTNSAALPRRHSNAEQSISTP